MTRLLPICALLVLACGADTPVPEALPADVEAISLLGDSLRRPALAAETEARMLAQLDSARRTWEGDTTSADALIWFGRRTAYLGRYREAIALFTTGVERFPTDARFLRHRGHRFITTRNYAAAITDFTNAATLIADTEDTIEPDGAPNARNIPTSTLHSNIWYHLGLSLYLTGDWNAALAAYSREAAIATNPDMLVATSWWRYLTLRRLGDSIAADSVLLPITRDMEIIENQAYHRLLLLAKGVLPLDSLLPGTVRGLAPSDAAIGYGVGAWHLIHGRKAEADALFRQLVQNGNWAAFGVIAAEAERARQ